MKRIIRSRHLLLLTLASTVFLGIGAPLHAEEDKTETLIAALSQRIAELSAIVNADTGAQHQLARNTGDAEMGLRISSLNADTTLRSGARGLTPETEWRRLFARKSGN
jgi:hypothetical protein